MRASLHRKNLVNKNQKSLHCNVMKNNIYQLLQNWHELLQAGILTEEEFAEKKAELLNSGNEKATANTIGKQPGIQQQVTPIRTEEEQAYIDAEYDRLFNNKSWFEKYRNLIISFLIIAILGTIIWYLFTSESRSLDNNNS